MNRLKQCLRDNNDFLLRLLCLLLVLGMLLAYQLQARGWAAAQAENQRQIAAAEAHNAQVLSQQAQLDGAAEQDGAADSAQVESLYADGVYTGTAAGFGGDITVQVTVEKGQLTDILILDASGEDASYLAMGQEIISDILDAQSTQVDTISGATFSSGGIRSAVEQALGEAVNGHAD